MRMLLAVAACLLASGTAQAQYSFEYGGKTIRVDPDRGTVSIPGVFDNTGKKSRRARSDQDTTRKPAKAEPQSPDQATLAPATAAQQPASLPPAPATSTTTGNVAPTETAAIPPAAAAPQVPPPAPVQQEAAAAAPPPPSVAPAVVTTEPPAPTANSKPAESVATASPPPTAAPAVQQPQVPAPAAAVATDPHSPVGIWLTEEKEGKVRIEQCGANLCGYSVDAKSNQNGEQVLINMRLGKDQKWSGRILDPNTGSTYDSTIALIGTNALRVQGCAFGGMFCGGQTWSRVN